MVRTYRKHETMGEKLDTFQIFCRCPCSMSLMFHATTKSSLDVTASVVVVYALNVLCLIGRLDVLFKKTSNLVGFMWKLRWSYSINCDSPSNLFWVLLSWVDSADSEKSSRFGELTERNNRIKTECPKSVCLPSVFKENHRPIWNPTHPTHQPKSSIRQQRVPTVLTLRCDKHL